MPVFNFKLHDSSTGESRFVSVAADSKDEAEETIYRQEMKKVNFELPAEEYTAFQDRLKKGELTGREKAQLYAHRQTKPYAIQKGKEA